MPRSLPLRMLPFMLLAHYLIFGMQLGVTGVLWSDLRLALGLSDGAFGLILLVTPMVGFLLLGAGAIVRDRFDRRTLAVAGLLLSAVGIVGVALAPNMAALVGARLLCGLGYGLNDAAVMGAALAWERAGKRALVGRLYAGFSLGAVVGALMSGWLLSMGWNYSAILLILAPLGFVLAGIAVLSPYNYGAAPAYQRAVQPLPWRGALIALALLSLSGALVEALVAGWLVIHLRALGSGPLIASFAYAGNDVAHILGRLGSTGLQRLAGERRALWVSAGLIGLGVVLLCSGSMLGSAVAFSVIGLGVAAVAPLVLSLGQQVAPGAGDAVARMVLAAGYFGFLIAGPLAGLLAGMVSVQTMLIGMIGVLGVLIAVLSVPATRSVQQPDNSIPVQQPV